MAIENLTKEKLIEYGFDEMHIERLFNWDNYEVNVSNNKGNFFASNIDNLIYSGKDKLRFDYFKENEKPRFPFADLELLPEYVEKSFEYFINEARKKAGSIIIEQSIKQRFIETEIEFIKAQIVDCKKYPDRNYKVSLLNKWELALDWLLAYSFQQTETKSDKLKAPVLGLFCNIINASSIDKKDETESVESYCKRVCEQYKLTYTDRIRQNFNGSNVAKTRKELIEKVLPLLDTETQNKIQKYLDSKNPSKQNLYA